MIKNCVLQIVGSRGHQAAHARFDATGKDLGRVVADLRFARIKKNGGRPPMFGRVGWLSWGREAWG